MGIFDNIVGKVKSDLEYKAGSEISSGIAKGAKDSLKKGDKCPKCKTPITESGLKFCPKCGAKLFVECPQCKKTFAVGTKFCTGCGKKLK